MYVIISLIIHRLVTNFVIKVSLYVNLRPYFLNIKFCFCLWINKCRNALFCNQYS